MPHTDLLFYVQRFVLGWYRGAAHLEHDFQRFVRTYRIAPEEVDRIRPVVNFLLQNGEPAS